MTSLYEYKIAGFGMSPEHNFSYSRTSKGQPFSWFIERQFGGRMEPASGNEPPTYGLRILSYLQRAATPSHKITHGTRMDKGVSLFLVA